MPESDVITNLSVEGSDEYVREMEKAADATGQVGDQAQQTAAKSKGGAKSLVKWAGAIGLTTKAVQGMKSSAKAAAGLAKGTIALQRVTGMDTKTASAWVSMAQARGIETSVLQKSFTNLGKAIRGANDGGKKSIKLFDELGISMYQLNQTDTEGKIRLVSDALLKIEDPLRRSAIGQQIFGRNWQKLAPLLAKGSAGIAKNEKAMEAAGLTMKDSGIATTKDLVAQQRTLQAQMLGVKVTIGQALLPVILQLAAAFVKLLEKLRPIFKWIAESPEQIIAAAKAIGVYIAATKGVTLAIKLWGVASKLTKISVRSLNAAMMANPIGLVTKAVSLLITGLVILYKKCDWFRNAVNAVWDAIKSGVMSVINFIKEHWDVIILLAGPIGVAVHVIARHWETVKAGVRSVVNFIKRVFGSLVGFFKDVAGKIGSALEPLLKPLEKVASGVGKVVGGAKSAAGWVGSKVGLAEGGTVMRGGTVLVGETGPELLSLPTGAQVTPLSGPAVTAPLGGVQTVISKVMLDKKVLATAVAQVNADRKARR